MIRRLTAPALALVLMVSACTDDDSSSGGGTVTVLAASSLTDAFTEIGEDFEDANPDTAAEFSFAASSELAVQIQEGAPADVFASADDTNMQKVVDSGDVTAEPVIFARNRLAIAVEPGNPRDISGLEDLADPDLVVILCASEVPCGRLADEALANAGVAVTPASRAENVRAALTPVALGEADAAIVYVTDVEATDDVDGVEIPRSENVVATYPIAATTAAGNAKTARAFVEFLRSDDGQRVLRDFGFLPP